MQKNWLDHWIRHHFLFQYWISCDQYPYLPIGAKVFSQPKATYKYRIQLRDEQSYFELSNRLRFDQVAYRPEMVRREGFLARLIEPDEYGSLTCRWVARILQFGLLGFITQHFPTDLVSSLMRDLL